MKRQIYYTLGIFMVVTGITSMAQSISPSFLAQADAASLSTTKASTVMVILGLVIFVIGLLMIILKILKGRASHG